ncbi:MAG: amino acid racemase [Oscillospiraceae bacterium]|jgi:aspartate racemase|nr:amino acid racemase [Oscillospiraceae bacterium]
MRDNKKLLGVLGGVGTVATACFLTTLADMTRVDRDQDHLNYLCYNHAAIPDRTAYILDDTQPNPLPILIDDVRWLESFGVDAIVIPCNTAHYFFDAIQDAVTVPIINILEETVSYVLARYTGARTVGILATSGTIGTNSYQLVCARHGLCASVPDAANQASLMAIIYEQVKAGLEPDVAELVRITDAMLAGGCDAVILGCTELSVVYRANKKAFHGLHVVDSTEALAARTIELMGGTILEDTTCAE